MAAETDDRGRLYLPSDLREEYGEKFHIVTYRDRIELVPIADDPLQAVRGAVGDEFEDTSIDELREEVLEEAKREVREDLAE